MKIWILLAVMFLLFGCTSHSLIVSPKEGNFTWCEMADNSSVLVLQLKSKEPFSYMYGTSQTIQLTPPSGNNSLVGVSGFIGLETNILSTSKSFKLERSGDFVLLILNNTADVLILSDKKIDC